jgi:prepilin-type N-terminal cleavage/methylation domain-containing protein
VVAETQDFRDGGFTLMEMIVVVLLVGLLSSVMVAVIAVVIRNAPSTEASADDSRSYQRLVTWLPRDVASTPLTPGGFDFGGGSMCAGAVGTSLVQMTWAPNDGQNTTYAADYRLNPSGNGSQVMRYTCSGTTGLHPYSGADVIEVTGIVRTAEATASGFGVTMRLTTCGDSECSIDGQLITVEAGSRNPSDALPSP